MTKKYIYNQIQKRIEKVNLRSEIPFNVKKIEEKLREFDALLWREFFPIKVYKNYKDFFSSTYAFAYAFAYAYASAFASAFASAYASASASAFAYASASAFASTFASAYASASASASASIDFYFVEFLESIKENKNGTYNKFINFQTLLLEAKEAGLGYCFRDVKNKTTNIIKCPTFYFDENKKRHSLTLPAVNLYNDKSEYWLYGVKFKKDLWENITSGKIKACDIMKIKNTDQRAVAIKIIGAEKIFKELKAKVIDEHTYPYGTDYLVELEGFLDGLKQPYKFIKGFNPEINDYVYVRTHPKCMTVEEAQSWCYRLELLNLNYQPNSRT